jgi:peptidoglycan hydrolase-like protein with peptidoglycan-binding domain
MWFFDEGGDRTVVDHVGGAHGTILGDSVTWVEGRIGGAVRFTGVPGESVDIASDFLEKGEGTLGLWIKPVLGLDRSVIFSANDAATASVGLSVELDKDGRFIVRFRTSATGTERIARSAPIFTSGSWQQVIFTLHDGTYALYVGGKNVPLEGDIHGPWFSMVSSASITYRMGASAFPSSPGTFRGDLDDLCFFNHGFTAADAELLNRLNAEYIASLPKSVSLSLNVDRYTPASGGSTWIRWTSANATSCSASGGWSGTRPTNGAERIASTSIPSTFFLTCSGSVGIPVKMRATIAFAEGVAATTTAADASAMSMPMATHEPILPKGCSEYLKTYMKRGQRNDNEDVKRLQRFLNETIDARLPESGYFGTMTYAAVKRFQVRYHDAIIKPWIDIGYDVSGFAGGTGYVYKTTKYQINLMKCATLGTPKPELERANDGR